MLISGVGSPGSVGPTSGGKTYAFNNIGVSPIVVAPPSTARTNITFYNPGTIVIYIFPTYVQALNSIPASIADQLLSPSGAALGGCWALPPSGGYLNLSGECQYGFQAFAASGSGNPLTVTDSNT